MNNKKENKLLSFFSKKNNDQNENNDNSDEKNDSLDPKKFQGLKKQILYPSFASRMMSCVIDFLLLSIIFNPIFRFLNNLLYKLNFGEKLNESELLEKIQATSNALNQVSNKTINHLDITKFVPYMIECLGVYYILLGVYFVLFWYKFNTTPGKFVMRIKIVKYPDYSDNLKISQAIKRYIGYIFWFISLILICIDPKKRAVHDRFASTVTIRS